jgi:signal transduction histidine kinase/DNA-binding response OmpR family regulator
LKINTQDDLDLSRILQRTLDAISDGIQIIGSDWRYLYLNETACRHGRQSREQLLGRSMMECYPGIDQTPMFGVLAACMKDRTTHQLDNEFAFDDGTHGLFELRIEPCPQGIFVLSVDVTERRRLETELRQTRKMDAIGQLAGGVAHDFNNLLMAMQGFTGFALEDVGPSHAVAADLREVLAAIDRASALTRQLLAFSSQTPVAARVLDVNALVGSLDRLLRRLLGEDVELDTKLTGEPWRTFIDPGSFEQLVINLAVNARDAMPKGGCLTIETLNVSIDEPQALSRGHVIPAGDYVVLAVTDEGTGMEPAIVEKIFEPFFTTKGAGKGTGLGLSTCYGIARQAGGHIWVYSEPGRGSTFKVYLPRVDGPVSETTASAPSRVVGGHETILLVEDDPQVRQVTERVLKRSGYTVLSAGSAQEAIDVCAAYASAPDLLLTDMTLPGGNGHELALRLRGRHPHVRALYISGYTEASIARRGGLPAGTVMLAKPFTAAALARRVRDVLDEARPEDAGHVAADQRPVVLIVDDEDALRRSLKRQLSTLGCDVLEASDGAQAIQMASDAAPAVIFLDLHMPGTDGPTLLRRLPVSGVRSSIVVMSGGGDIDDVIAALRNGAADYLKKPWSTEDLVFALRRALDIHRVAAPGRDGSGTAGDPDGT